MEHHVCVKLLVYVCCIVWFHETDFRWICFTQTCTWNFNVQSTQYLSMLLLFYECLFYVARRGYFHRCGVSSSGQNEALVQAVSVAGWIFILYTCIYLCVYASILQMNWSWPFAGLGLACSLHTCFTCIYMFLLPDSEFYIHLCPQWTH